MKTKLLYFILFYLLSIILSVQLFSQVPEQFSYQAVIRDNNQQLVTDKAIGLRISILKDTENGSPIYIETMHPSTNHNGLITVKTGEGTIVSGNFSEIEWESSNYFIKTEVDPEGGTSYTITGVSPLLSVPYALHSQTADSIIGSIQESDPVFSSSVAKGISGTDTAAWNAASVGSYNETDPVFSSATAAGISNEDTSAWNNKQDPLTGSEPLFENWDKDFDDDFNGDYRYLENQPSILDSILVYAVTLNDTQIVHGAKTFTGHIRVPSPVEDEDAVNKSYVDAMSSFRGWSITGNEGTDPDNNFLGTKDLQPVVFGVNSQERMRLSYHGNLSFNGTGNSIFIGKASGNIDVLEDNCNVFIGDSAGSRNTTGVMNVAAGFEAMEKNITGYFNTATGAGSLALNTNGNSNSAFGTFAMGSNTTGDQNAAFGFNSLSANTTGDSNTALGSECLSSNHTGSYNTGSGGLSLASNTYGSFNSALGFGALSFNISGNANSGFGYYALFSNRTGIRNTGIGTGAMQNNRSGMENVAVGYQALYSDTMSYENTALGFQALYSNRYSGSSNTAVGYRSLYSNTIGSANTANGYSVLGSNTLGSSNTAIGYNSMASNTEGYCNTAIGYHSLSYNVEGAYNTAIGYSSGPEVGYLINTTAVGFNATPTANNTIRIGDNNIVQIGGFVGWSNLSDGRFKTNIQSNVPGLDFILKLNPVTFYWDMRAMEVFNNKHNYNKRDPEDPGLDSAIMQHAQKLHSGFIAQEVEDAAKTCDYDFSGLIKPANENSKYNLSYAEFVVPLVKAVQEMHKENEILKQQYNTEMLGLKKEIEKLKETLKQLH